MTEILRHVRTGGLYEVLFRGAAIHSNVPLGDDAPITVCRRLPDSQIVARFGPPPRGTFEVLHHSRLQTDVLRHDGAEVVVYRALNGGPVWVRPTAEMDDGRFEPASAVGAPETTIPGGEVEGRDWRDRGLTNAERLIVLASYHRGKLGPDLVGELEELANEWMEEVETARTALLAVVRSSGGGEKKGASSGPDCRPSDRTPSGFAGPAASIPRASCWSVKVGEETTLAECEIGLFLSDYGTLCLKSEYGNNEGRIDAYIIDSGEFFWGDLPQTIASQRASRVWPVEIEVPAPGGETRRAENAAAGSVHEHPIAVGEAPSSTPARQEEGSRNPMSEVVSEVLDRVDRSPEMGFLRKTLSKPPTSPTPDATSGGEAAGRDDQTAQFIAESGAIEREEAEAQRAFRADPGAPLLEWDRLWPEIKAKYRQQAKTNLAMSDDAESWIVAANSSQGE